MSLDNIYSSMTDWSSILPFVSVGFSWEKMLREEGSVLRCMDIPFVDDSLRSSHASSLDWMPKVCDPSSFFIRILLGSLLFLFFYKNTLCFRSRSSKT